MKIMKFGGSSIANASLIKKVVEIILGESKKDKVSVVLSAMKGITDSLKFCAESAEKGKYEYKEVFKKVKDKHLHAIKELFTNDARDKITEEISTLLYELEEILHGVELVKECSLRSLDFIMSFGEKLSCRIVSSYLINQSHRAIYIDASDDLIVTDNQHGNATVLFAKSYSNIKKRIKNISDICIITGFIASTENGITTTLGRNGSDYTASIIAAGCDAELIEIWTDVDGVLSADPRCVKNSFVIPELSYQEAMELSYFGAEVIHPYTMIPAVEKKIKIVIKNTLNPKVPGTVISDSGKKHITSITGIACIDDVAIINVEGGGMIGIPGIASHILSEVANKKLNIVMISQASSEHSICLVLKESEAEIAQDVLNNSLSFELESKWIERIELLKDLVIIAVIGENMRGTPGISGKLFSALGKEKINVYAIAQGSSERNISFVTSKKDKRRALDILHQVFLTNG